MNQSRAEAPVAQPDALSVREFRRELLDKIGVIKSASAVITVQRHIVRQQVIDFLSDRYREALAWMSASQAPVVGTTRQETTEKGNVE